MKLDRFSKQQAIDYADIESELRGFSRGSAQWKKAFREHAQEAFSTMSLGRNPRSNPRASHYKAYVDLYPDIFGANGFAGIVARSYQGKSGDKGANLDDIQNRIMASVVSLAKLFENGILNAKTTTRGNRQGHIPDDAMSDFQFPTKTDKLTEKEYADEVLFVVHNWFMRDAVMNCILESLSMFWSMSKSDMAAVMETCKINIAPEGADDSESKASMMEAIGEARKRWIVRLRGKIHQAASALNFKKIYFKE